MDLTMHFEGYIAEIIDRALERGIVKTKTEAVRLSLLKLNEEFHLVDADWHPADSREFKSGFVSSVRRSGREKPLKAKSVSELLG